MKRKAIDPKVKEVARRFMEEIEKILKDKVVAVVAFGSRVWGEPSGDSDYDLMVIHRGDRASVEEAAADVALKLSAELKAGVEPIAVSVSEFRGGDRHLTVKCKKEGFILYPDGGEREAKRREAMDIFSLAEEFLDIAKLLLKFKMYRGVVDEAYNAAELAVKALMLWDGHDIPGSHGGIVGEFGRLYALTGKVEKPLGRALSLALEKRNRARYDARAEVKEDEARAALETAEKLIEEAKRILRREESRKER